MASLDLRARRRTTVWTHRKGGAEGQCRQCSLHLQMGGEMEAEEEERVNTKAVMKGEIGGAVKS